MAEPLPSQGVQTVAETAEAGAPPLWRHAELAAELPWLVQGTTGRGRDADMGLFGALPVGRAMERWHGLRERFGMPRMVHARQVHGTRVLRHEDHTPGLLIQDAADGHHTAAPGILLTVSTADCVPVFLVDEDARAVALLHAGWRGVAGGMLEAGARALAALGGGPEGWRVHFGPAICGPCYEVGPEVHAALGLPEPAAPTPVDLRAYLARKAVALGVPPARVSISTHCTRCDGQHFYSHRGGNPERQISVLGIRPGAAGT
ncbi:MAG: polyphenol oxidase family protein [Gemmatimonadota bacterium]